MLAMHPHSDHNSIGAFPMCADPAMADFTMLACAAVMQDRPEIFSARDQCATHVLQTDCC